MTDFLFIVFTYMYVQEWCNCAEGLLVWIGLDMWDIFCVESRQDRQDRTGPRRYCCFLFWFSSMHITHNNTNMFTNHKHTKINNAGKIIDVTDEHRCTGFVVAARLSCHFRVLASSLYSALHATKTPLPVLQFSVICNNCDLAAKWMYITMMMNILLFVSSGRPRAREIDGVQEKRANHFSSYVLVTFSRAALFSHATGRPANNYFFS
jgi:hypothetical protein